MLDELLDNQSNRLRFDTWNVNGLIIFKETANFMINYLDLYKCLKAKAVKMDRYKEIYRFLKILMSMLGKCINGGYINFAICDFYHDNSFVQLSKMIFEAIQGQSLTEMKQYEKINKALHRFVSEFFKKNMELVFLKFDQETIKYVVE